ncbi:hypothetical protein EMWEY_00057490, partial [Eimeria maxima]
RLWALHTKLA